MRLRGRSNAGNVSLILIYSYERSRCLPCTLDIQDVTNSKETFINSFSTKNVNPKASETLSKKMSRGKGRS